MNEYPVTYGVKLKEYDSSSSGNYFEIPLTEDIEEYDVEVGDETFVTLERNADPAYVRIQSEKVRTRHTPILKKKDVGYRVTFPKEYVKEDTAGSPFSGLRNKDKVNVEYNEDHLRVYTPKDYQERTTQLASEDRTPEFKVPVGLLLADSVFEEQGDGFTDVAGETEFEGQRVRLKPFEGLTETFQREASAQAAEPIVTQKDFFNVLEGDGVEGKQVDFLKVYWNPAPVNPRSPEQGESVLGGFGKESWELVLPKQGTFVFEAQSEGETCETFLTYCDDAFRGVVEPDIGGKWFGQYVDVDAEGVVKVYLPVPSYSERDGGISWQSGTRISQEEREEIRLRRMTQARF